MASPLPSLAARPTISAYRSSPRRRPPPRFLPRCQLPLLPSATLCLRPRPHDALEARLPATCRGRRGSGVTTPAGPRRTLHRTLPSLLVPSAGPSFPPPLVRPRAQNPSSGEAAAVVGDGANAAVRPAASCSPPPPSCTGCSPRSLSRTAASAVPTAPSSSFSPKAIIVFVKSTDLYQAGGAAVAAPLLRAGRRARPGGGGAGQVLLVWRP